MAASAKFKIVILWAHEVRLASRLLKEVHEMVKNPDHNKEEVNRLASAALRASYAALYDDAIKDGAALTICDDPNYLPRVEIEDNDEDFEGEKK